MKDHDIIQGLRDYDVQKTIFISTPKYFCVFLAIPHYLEKVRWHISRFSQRFSHSYADCKSSVAP